MYLVARGYRQIGSCARVELQVTGYQVIVVLVEFGMMRTLRVIYVEILTPRMSGGGGESRRVHRVCFIAL